jgi:hypothetical protein
LRSFDRIIAKFLVLNFLYALVAFAVSNFDEREESALRIIEGQRPQFFFGNEIVKLHDTSGSTP